MFDQVLIAANQRLNPMSAGRYTLERALEGSGRGRRGLGIQVHDTYTGKPRPTATLSGGESFIAALALARPCGCRRKCQQQGPSRYHLHR